jgi:hypothetical protein
MDKLFNIITYLIGFLFLLMGLQWLVDPTSAAAGLGMSLLSGHGLSTQIGDLASFFLVVGVFTLCAAVKKNKVWLYTPIALFGFAAVSRLIAFLFHDAALSTDKILVELYWQDFYSF